MWKFTTSKWYRILRSWKGQCISHRLNNKAIDAVIVVSAQNIILMLGNGRWNKLRYCPGSDCYPSSWLKKRGPKKTMRKWRFRSSWVCCHILKNSTFLEKWTWLLTRFFTAVLVMALTAMDNLSCSFSFPEGCTQQSILLPEIAI